jgi:hypothetical protein
MMAPHVTGLQDHILPAGQRHHLLQVLEVCDGRFLHVEVFACAECEQRVAGVIAHRTFHGDDAAAFQQLILGEQFHLQLLARLSGGGILFADAHDLEVARLEQQPQFLRPVRMGDAEEADRNARLRCRGREQ